MPLLDDVATVSGLAIARSHRVPTVTNFAPPSSARTDATVVLRAPRPVTEPACLVQVVLSCGLDRFLPAHVRGLSPSASRSLARSVSSLHAQPSGLTPPRPSPGRRRKTSKVPFNYPTPGRAPPSATKVCRAISIPTPELKFLFPRGKGPGDRSFSGRRQRRSTVNQTAPPIGASRSFARTPAGPKTPENNGQSKRYFGT